ncbi:hypothetical protein BBB56_12125 [Candidatus Pantoea deserta]|uniref:Uncharacterized protein n=1 Tax=Candidatus Pantoea deserta TaxID=1869313 RepID=A0A3N4PL37_9GAMM|nr:hypothetical protein BBB56_12125 [Pantoea deserta]
MARLNAHFRDEVRHSAGQARRDALSDVAIDLVTRNGRVVNAPGRQQCRLFLCDVAYDVVL